MRSFGFGRFVVAAIAASSVLVGAGAGALADTSANWPGRSIKLIVPFPAGGAADTIARIYGEKLSEALKQPVVVENKAGAGTAIAADAAAKADPDGYTLSLAPAGQLTILPHLNKSINYDPFKSFATVSLLASVPDPQWAPDVTGSDLLELYRSGQLAPAHR